MRKWRYDDPQVRDGVIEQAILAGTFPASRTAHYRKLWARDPRGTFDLIGQLASLPAAAAALALDEGLPGAWFPELRGTVTRERHGSTVPSRDEGEGLPVELFPELMRAPIAAGRVKFCT